MNKKLPNKNERSDVEEATLDRIGRKRRKKRIIRDASGSTEQARKERRKILFFCDRLEEIGEECEE